VTSGAARPDLIMVVPAYNEAGRLDPAPWLAFLDAHPGCHFYFVNDGSTDATAQLLETMQSRHPDQIRVVSQAVNGGKAEAVRVGMLQALAHTAQYAGFIDADLSSPLTEIGTLRRELDEFPDLWAAFGSRIKLLGRHVERYATRHYLGRVFATGASLALSLPVYDSQCGLKLFRDTPDVRAAFAAPFRSRWLFDVELLDRLATAAGAKLHQRIHEVPLRAWADPGGSKLGLTDFLRVPFQLLMIRWRRSR
jgi:dolichyl-phosphate beta-glucosyltransferase